MTPTTPTTPHTRSEVVMHEIHVNVTSLEEAFDGTAELWSGGEFIGFTRYEDNDLMLWIEPRRDGAARVVGARAIETALAEANRLLASY